MLEKREELKSTLEVQNETYENCQREVLELYKTNGSLEENFTLNSGYRLSTDILGENDNPLFKLNLGNDGEQSEFDYNYGELEDGNGKGYAT